MYCKCVNYMWNKNFKCLKDKDLNIPELAKEQIGADAKMQELTDFPSFPIQEYYSNTIFLYYILWPS